MSIYLYYKCIVSHWDRAATSMQLVRHSPALVAENAAGRVAARLRRLERQEPLLRAPEARVFVDDVGKRCLHAREPPVRLRIFIVRVEHHEALFGRCLAELRRRVRHDISRVRFFSRYPIIR